MGAPVMKALPRIAGTIAGRPPTSVSETTRPSKAEPITEAWLIVSPVAAARGLERRHASREAGAGSGAVEAARGDNDGVFADLVHAPPGPCDLDD